MDAVHNDVKDVNGHPNKTLAAIDSAKVEDQTDGEEDYCESNSLLPPKPGGMSREPEKTRRVQWNDKNGNKLAEILEFEPSDVSDSDDEDSDSCICIIM